ncbi:hypothetical protein EJ063_07135 [Vibrio aquaticus]|uniref:Uncharacterized protein n=1 Tax=Vibrio aquaticus TaxID=2496559 RepID=A0A3S0MKQ8_9VIBR|nr:hypothetical protein [Vibrio aquaticus]RTZ16565.1 hypothetical protein EJ063_07135 [Vibrio aquaticus]
MKRMIAALLLSTTSTFAAAADNACLSKKYDAYIDASLHWYEDLAQLTSEQYPDLKEVSEWFLEGRKHHFELNRAAVHYYLVEDQTKVATAQPVEAWLQLEQKDIKTLSTRGDELGQLAKVTFDDRQSKPHEKNYELRSAFADLLSHPTKIDSALKRYNASIKQLEAINCQ